MPRSPGLIALTGGTGFVGAAILREALARNLAVRGLARNPEALAAGAEPLPGRLEDTAALQRLCAGAETVIHCAGAIRARNATEFSEANVAATQRLARIAAEAGVRRFVFISSLAARQPEVSPYAASKRAAERVFEQAGGGPDWLILRPPAIYGPGDRATLPIFRQAARGVLLVPSRPGLKLSLLHVADLARLIMALAEEHGPVGRIIEPTVASEGYSWDEIAAAGAAAAGRTSLRAIRVPYWAAYAAGALINLLGVALRQPPLFSVGKAREAFHPDWVGREAPADLPCWRPAIALAEGFRGTFAWYRERKWL